MSSRCDGRTRTGEIINLTHRRGAASRATQLYTSGVTRFSIDFRTVHFDDVVEKRGAPNIDAACTGTVMRDFLRGTDFARLPDDIVAMYDNGN